jgi:general secretion pathway protein E
MPRHCLVLFAALAIYLSADQMAFAQSVAPWPVDAGDYVTDPTKFVRGPGFYLSWVKILLSWSIFLAWVYTSDWVNQDAQRMKFKFETWNAIVCFSFIGAFILLWLLPWYLMSFPLLLVAYAVPLTAYIKQRNAKVSTADQVLTPEHIRFWLSQRLRKYGVKIDAQSKKKSIGPTVALTSRGGANDRDDSANLLSARQAPGFPACGELLHQALTQGAGGIMLDFSREATAIRYQVDGVWGEVQTRDRESGDAILAVMKTLSALNPAERTARQKGSFGAEHEKKRYVCKFTSQGIKTGERALVQFDDGVAQKARLIDIGMRQKMQDDLKALLGQKRGLVLVSAPPGGGLTTLMAATVGAVDRFMRSAVGVEEVTNRDMIVENVPITTFSAAQGQTPATVLPELIRQYPDVFVVPDLADAQTVGILCEQVVGEDRLVVASIRSKEAPEALLRVLMLKVPIKQFVPAITAVVNQRLIRKLCETCKQAYTPPPQVLQQMGLPADRVESFYRPPQPPPPEPGKDPPPVCSDCKGVGYRGRTGIFEFLVVDDLVRTTLLKQPQLDSVKAAARKAGMRSLQEEGIMLVAKGVTSVQELMRVLKE